MDIFHIGIFILRNSLRTSAASTTTLRTALLRMVSSTFGMPRVPTGYFIKKKYVFRSPDFYYGGDAFNVFPGGDVGGVSVYSDSCGRSSPGFAYPDYPGYSFGVMRNGYVGEYDYSAVYDSYGNYCYSLRTSTISIIVHIMLKWMVLYLVIGM